MVMALPLKPMGPAWAEKTAVIAKAVTSHRRRELKNSMS